LTYRYYNTSTAVGELYNIKNVYLVNTIKTVNGPVTNMNFAGYSTATETRETLKFFVLNFKEKPIKELVFKNNTYVDKDNENLVIKEFDELSLYKVYTHENSNYTLTGVYSVTNGNLSSIGFDPEDEDRFISRRVVLTATDGQVFTFDYAPVINTAQFLYNTISIGNGIYLECAYQEKVVEYDTEEEWLKML